MNQDNHDQFAERWLDKTLSRYSDTEPRDGLEGRILANLAAQKSERAPAWRRLLWIPIACAAVIAFAVGMAVLRHAKPSSVNAPVVASAPTAPAQPAHVRSAIAPATQRAAAVHQKPANRAPKIFMAKAAEPRQSQFPAPTPPTEQERLLLAYLSATPTHELLAVAADQREWRERVQQNAEAAVQNRQPGREINHLQVSPPEGGRTEAGAFGAR